MPLKPAKRGIKVWMLCTSHLVYSLNIYDGRNDAVKQSNNELGYNVIINLIQPLKSKYHALYFEKLLIVSN